MQLRILKTDKDHAEALAEIDRLFDLDPEEGTPEADRFELLADLIDRYERKEYPIDDVPPVEIIQFIMDENGLKQKDMIPYIGSASKVSEVLSGARSLSKAMIQRLHHELGIPASLLIDPPDQGADNDRRTGSTRSQRQHV
ncbi:antitoxin HigA [bacterium BMS3Bbin04]|nr:antitoxin HigA [bacterium BMS3Bbin04]